MKLPRTIIVGLVLCLAAEAADLQSEPTASSIDNHRHLPSDWEMQQEQFEARLHDEYAQDMAGMELWMRQEYGHALTELKQQHAKALNELELKLRQEHETALAQLKEELLKDSRCETGR